MTRPGSTLARLQQASTFLLAAFGIGWLAWYRDRSPAFALAGLALVPVVYCSFIALELIAIRCVSRRDPTPRASWRALARACLAEGLQGVRVFCWRQPFRWSAVADRTSTDGRFHGKRGVVFIPGFICNRGFWNPWLKKLEAADRPFAALNLEPVFGSIDDYIPLVEEAVAAVTAASGMAPILVCHSMGGLAARAWLRDGRGAARIHHVITIGTPHRGTWLASFSSTRNGRQMAPGNDWLRELEVALARHLQPAFSCFYSNCDNVVFPPSTATLPGADNRFVAGRAHVELAFRPEVIAASLALLDAR